MSDDAELDDFAEEVADLNPFAHDPTRCSRCGGRRFFYTTQEAGRQCLDCDPIVHKTFATFELVYAPTISPEEVGPPCPKCGERVLFWWNMKDGRRCSTCDPPKKSRQLLKFNEEQAKNPPKPAAKGR